MSEVFWHPNAQHQRFRYEGYDGNLTESQEKCLQEVSKHFASFDLTPCMIPGESRATLFLRFLRARKFSVPKAIDMLTGAYKYKTKEVNVMHLRKMTAKDVLGCDEGEVNRFWPQYIHGTDREGRLIMIVKAGLIDAKSLLKVVSIETFTKYIVWRMEFTRKLMAMNQERTGYFSESLLLIFDMTGFSMGRYNRDVRQCITRFTEIMQNYYPESNGATYIVNTITLFKVVWSFASRLLDTRTRRKISILSSDYADELHEVASKNCLPRELGGELKNLELDDPVYYVTFEDAEDLISPAKLKEIEDEYLVEEARRHREEEERREQEEEARREEEQRRLAEEEKARCEKRERERIAMMRVQEELRKERERERLEEERRQKEIREAEVRRREMAKEERRKEKLRQKEKEEREKWERIRLQKIMCEAALRKKEEEEEKKKKKKRRKEAKELLRQMLRRQIEEVELRKREESEREERLRIENAESEERECRENTLRKERRRLEAAEKRRRQEEDARRRSEMRTKWENDATFQRDVQKWRDEVLSEVRENTKVMSLRMRASSLESLGSPAGSPALSVSPHTFVDRTQVTLSEKRVEEVGTTRGDTRIFAFQKFVLRMDVAFHSEFVVQFLTSARQIGFQILNNGSEVGDGLKICNGKYGQVSGALVKVAPGSVHIRWDNSYRANSDSVLETETVKYVVEWKRIGRDDEDDVTMPRMGRTASTRRRESDLSARCDRRTSPRTGGKRRRRRPSRNFPANRPSPSPLDGDDCAIS